MPQSRFLPIWLNYVLVWLQKYDWRGKHFANKVMAHKIDNRPSCVPVGEGCFCLKKS